MNKSKVGSKYVSYSRIHIALLDMNGNMNRRHMSLGIKLREPNWVFYVRKHSEFCVLWKSDFQDRSDEVLNIVKNLKNELDFKIDPVEITICKGIPAHVGLGSTTSLYIGTIKAILSHFDFGLEPEKAVRISKRGGVSGLGFIYNYLDKSGFLLDSGIGASNKKPFRPSHFTNNKSVPKVLFNHKFPTNRVLFLWPDVEGVFGKAEKDLFELFCPIEVSEVERLSRMALVSLLPNVIERNKENIFELIDEIQDVGFKKMEIQSYGTKISEIIEKTRSLGGSGVGMSSFGPGIYVLGGNLDLIEENMRMEPSIRMAFQSSIFN